MTTLAIPDDLIVEVHPRQDRPAEFMASVQAKKILEIPTTLTGVWDGPTPAQFPDGPFILLDIRWHRSFAGYGFEDCCRMVAELAAHLAAADKGWPSTVAHVRALPVVDIRFSFIVAPTPVPEWDGRQTLQGLAEKLAGQLDGTAPDVAAKIRGLAADDGCDCEGCDCRG